MKLELDNQTKIKGNWNWLRQGYVSAGYLRLSRPKVTSETHTERS